MTDKCFDKLFWDAAVDLGDAIVLNGAVRYWAQICDKLYYPAKGEYFDTLTCLYQDEPNIEVWRFFEDIQHEIFLVSNPMPRLRVPKLKTTHVHRVNCSPEKIHVNWPQQIYENINVPFHIRYDYFKLPKHIPGQFELFDRLTQGQTEYALVHRRSGTNPNPLPILLTPEIGSNIQNLLIIEIAPGLTNNLLDFVKLIRHAREIHCIASSFFNLVDSMLDQTQAQCFFHDARANSMMQVNSRYNNHRWKCIDYGFRA